MQRNIHLGGNKYASEHSIKRLSLLVVGRMLFSAHRAPCAVPFNTRSAINRSELTEKVSSKFRGVPGEHYTRSRYTGVANIRTKIGRVQPSMLQALDTRPFSSPLQCLAPQVLNVSTGTHATPRSARPENVDTRTTILHCTPVRAK